MKGGKRVCGKPVKILHRFAHTTGGVGLQRRRGVAWDADEMCKSMNFYAFWERCDGLLRGRCSCGER